MYDYDIIVVGAGPGGSAAAEKCAKVGLKTLLLEKEKLPRDKPCGGLIGPNMMRDINRYDYAIEAIAERKIDEYQFHIDEKCVFSTKAQAYSYSREKLDYHITKKAIGSGAKLIDNCRVSDIIANTRKVKVITPKGTFVSKIVIGADGVNSIVAKKTGLNNGWSKNDSAIAIESEIKMSNKEIEKRFGNSIMIHIDRDFIGYKWIIPKNGCINVGLGTKLSRSLKLRAQFSTMLEQLNLEADDIKAHMIPMKLLKNTHNYRKRVILCGDAGGFVYPLMGAGIEPAITTGRAAADICYDAIKNDDFSSDVFCRYDSFCKSLVRDISISRVQLKMVETCIKYRLMNSFLAKRTLQLIDATFKLLYPKLKQAKKPSGIAR